MINSVISYVLIPAAEKLQNFQALKAFIVCGLSRFSIF